MAEQDKRNTSKDKGTDHNLGGTEFNRVNREQFNRTQANQQALKERLINNKRGNNLSKE